MNISSLRLAILALVVWDLTARPAHAYLDPGIGSHAFQVALAGLFGGIFALKAMIQGLVFRLRTWRQK
ncbi:hypothetical protein [Armatimonas sp.]|uniref:hypothetical protein n=1 Tax=Armatimonas sp. TaxID=1872638 RepID=UPI00286AD2D8|nr:hypothetical protein [Armatimonas sp.]